MTQTLFGMVLAVLVFLWKAPTALGEVVLLAPSMVTSQDGEFPESYFGSSDEKGSRAPAYESASEASRIEQMRSVASAHSGVQEVALIASNMGYFPEVISVTRDIPVNLFLITDSKKPLCLIMDDKGMEIRKQIKAQEISEVRFTPRQVGTHRFYCPINGIEGTLVVKDVHIKEKD